MGDERAETSVTPLSAHPAANLHMCRESKMPSVLTENLFIDVASDAARLKRDDILEALIEGHVVGIAKYLGLKKKQAEKPSDPVLSVFVDGVNIGKFCGSSVGSASDL